MKINTAPFWLLLAVSLLTGASAFAQYAPGEDPVVLNNKVTYQYLPLNNQRKSGDLDKSDGIPAWMQAKISRYTAKAYSAQTTGIKTEQDVINTVQSNGLSTTCVQESGTSAASSTTGFNRYGPKAADQVVVLRGDLVNICY